MLADCVGSYFHPFAALANHSCDHNAIVGFAGDVLYLKALRPIKKDEQIFVSYINTTEPYEFRQRVLSDQYYFDCRCSKCMKGTDTREDRFLTTPEDIEAVKLIDRQVHETLAPQDTLGNDAGAGKAASGMHTLRQTSIWPITRQPYVSLRSDLISNLLEIGRFKEAFVHSFVRYTRIDPIIYEEGHPLRQVHAWGLAKLAIYLCPDIVVKPDYSDIRKFGIDFSLIIWSILSDLVAKESQACTVPTLKRAVRASFMEVQGQYAAIGIDPRRMGTEIESEWEKVGKMVDECLKKQ